MKIQAATLAASAAAVSAASPVRRHLPTEISAASDLGRSLLSQSRRLDGDDDDEDATTWIAGYSLKFQGCRHHASLNLDGDDNNDGDDNSVRVKTTKLAHFRLCPADSCSGWLGGGCSSNYGDYVVDLASFAETYVEGQKRASEYQCQMYVYENCDCAETDDRDDGFDREYCEYDCYANSRKMKDCIDRNPYEEEEEGEREREFEAQRYAECEEWEMPEYDDDDDGNNNNNQQGGGDDEDEEVRYYIGPYCSDNGGAVYLGMYTDDTCTNFADSSNGAATYKTLSRGQDLPYSSTSLITSDCIACIEQEDPNRSANSNDNADDDAYAEEEQSPEVSDQCARLYESAGKCESGINVAKSGMTSDPDTAACSYISGIQFTKSNGVVEITTSKSATFFAVAFAAVFMGLVGIVYRLRKDLEEARKSPLLEKEDSQEDQPVLL